MPKTKRKTKPPETRELNLVATLVDLEAASDEESRELRRFSMTAYTGGQMTLAGWRHPVVVDLQGMDVGKQNRPILLDHTRDVDFVMGQTDQIAVSGDELRVSGQIMGDSAKAQQVIALADKGFAWQASIGARAADVEFVPAGKTAQANGREFSGPVNIARRSTLGEVSFVVLGADDNTSAQIAAGKPNKEIDMEFAEWVEAQGFAADDLNETQIASFEKLFSASKPATTDPLTDTAGAVATLRAEMAAETSRIASIRKICAGRHEVIEAQAIADGWDETRAELEVLRASRPAAPAIHANGGGSPTAKVLEAAVCVAGQLDGIEKAYDEQTLEAADKRFRGRIGLQELLLEAAWSNGYTGRSFRSDMRGVLQAAFSTFSLPGILSNTANKFLLQGFTTVESAWRAIAAIRSVSDFKQVTSYRLTGGFEYEEVGPDGELKHAQVGEESFTNQAKTYGKMFSLTRTDLINDDLGALTAVPTRLGRGAALKLNDVFWKEFLANAAFFAAGNNNYADGADTALAIDGLTKAEQLFLDQTDPDGHPLAVMPEILLVPNALYALAGQLMNSTEFREDGNSSKSKYPTSNPHAGKFRVHRSSYLSNALYTGNSNKAWYLLADPSSLPVIEVAFLNGQERPTVESADADFNVLGIQMRGYHDFGVAKQDHRGGVKLKGEA
ncbi:MAG: hypothetical protein R3E01_13545 [Pirellulaceae bacterium]